MQHSWSPAKKRILSLYGREETVEKYQRTRNTNFVVFIMIIVFEREGISEAGIIWFVSGRL
jgi:hypothetical protein